MLKKEIRNGNTEEHEKKSWRAIDETYRIVIPLLFSAVNCLKLGKLRQVLSFQEFCFKDSGLVLELSVLVGIGRSGTLRRQILY